MSAARHLRSLNRRVRAVWRRWRYRGTRRKTDTRRTDLVVAVAGSLLVAALVATLTLLLTR